MTDDNANKVQPLAPVRPIVAIVGQPNAGKSTLFNRLLGKRWAIINDQPGVTRDRIHAETDWQGRKFTLVDTGGFVPRAKETLVAAVCAQAQQAMDEADLVVLLCDATVGVTDVDREVVKLLRRKGCPSLLAVNKVDHPEQEPALDDFHSLGLGDPVAVSASTGRRSGDLLDAVVERFDDVGPDSETDDAAIKVVLTGRPNVGKSTLINRLAGQRISIVHEQPGTTRDTTHIRVAWQGREFVLLDTAGLRRRSRVHDQIEYYSNLRASSSIAAADVAVVLVDASEGCTMQDVRVMNQVTDAGHGLVVAVNKWDLIDTGPAATGEFLANLRRRYNFLVDYPVVFISALTGKRVMKCLEAAAQVYANCRLRVPTARLNRLVGTLSSQAPPRGAGREIKLLYATQHAVAPPTFVVFSNRPELVTDSYRRFLEKHLRSEFEFTGTPVRVVWRRRRPA